MILSGGEQAWLYLAAAVTWLTVLPFGVCFAQPSSVPAINQTSSGANSASIGVNNGTVTINQQDPAVLAAMVKVFADQMSATAEAKAQAEAKVADLASELGVTTAAVAQFFRIVGEQNVPPDKIAERLSQIAMHFAETQEVLASLRPDDPAAAELAAKAKQALDAGRLDEADQLLDRAKDLELAAYRAARHLRTEAQHAEDQHAMSAAKLLGSLGGVALTRLDYRAAADDFRQAADLLPMSKPREKSKYLFQQADALYLQGYEFGDDAALSKAIKAYRNLVPPATHYLDQRGWAKAEYKLGTALLRMGEHTLDQQYFEEAIAAYQAALREQTRDQAPMAWAATQNVLGLALYRAGRTREAIAAYTAALQERTRERYPNAWAETQGNLGLALVDLGQSESASENLLAAISAYLAALEVDTRDKSPFEWARLQNDLGWTFLVLGQRDNDTSQIEQSVALFRASLSVRTRHRLPFLWGLVQDNLGRALTALGERESGAESLQAAVTAFEAAIEVRDRDHEPQQWALVTQHEAAADMLLAQRLKDQTKAGEAVTLLESACAYLMQGSHDASHCQAQLTKAHAVVAQLKSQ